MHDDCFLFESPTPFNLRYPSPGETNALVAQLGYLAHAVAGHDHSRTLVDELLHCRQDDLCGSVVECRGWLVQDEQPGTDGKCSRQGYSLAFPTREMRRVFVRFIADIQSLQPVESFLMC